MHVKINLKYGDDQITITEIPKKVKTNELNINSLTNDIKILTRKIDKIDDDINKIKKFINYQE